MTMQETIRLFNNYLNSNHKQRIIDIYAHVLVILVHEVPLF